MYDIIGDVHGCYDELLLLLDRLGYTEDQGIYRHPEGRKLVFVGDITDRGPKSIACLLFVTKHVRSKQALYVPGNHCDKLYRFFLGRNVQVTHGLETTVSELGRLSSSTKETVKKEFIALFEQAPLYLTLDEGRLIVCHAGHSPGLYRGKSSKSAHVLLIWRCDRRKRCERFSHPPRLGSALQRRDVDCLRPFAGEAATNSEPNCKC